MKFDLFKILLESVLLEGEEPELRQTEPQGQDGSEEIEDSSVETPEQKQERFYQKLISSLTPEQQQAVESLDDHQKKLFEAWMRHFAGKGSVTVSFDYTNSKGLASHKQARFNVDYQKIKQKQAELITARQQYKQNRNELVTRYITQHQQEAESNKFTREILKRLSTVTKDRITPQIKKTRLVKGLFIQADKEGIPVLRIAGFLDRQEVNQNETEANQSALAQKEAERAALTGPKVTKAGVPFKEREQTAEDKEKQSILADIDMKLRTDVEKVKQLEQTPVEGGYTMSDYFEFIVQNIKNPSFTR
jgi:hemerythrin